MLREGAEFLRQRYFFHLSHRSYYWAGPGRGFLLASRRDRIGDHSANYRHQNHRENKDTIGELFDPMHSANAAGTQGRIRKQTSDEKQQGVSRQKIVRNRIDFSESDDDADEPDHGQTNADHGRRDGEDMNANIFLKMLVWIWLGHGKCFAPAND